MRNNNDPLVELRDIVRPDRTAVLVVDMQNDFCHEDGFFGKGNLDEQGYGRRPADLSYVRAATSNILGLLEKARNSDVRICYVFCYMDDERLPPMLRLRKIRINRQAVLVPEGKWGSEPYDGLVPHPGDMVVRRHHYSAFIGTGLANSLNGAGIETIIVTGVATNVCCETTIRDGCCEGFYVVVPRDCLATYDRVDHERALEHMDNYYALVTDSQEIVKLW